MQERIVNGIATVVKTSAYTFQTKSHLTLSSFNFGCCLSTASKAPEIPASGSVKSKSIFVLFESLFEGLVGY